MQIKRLRDDSYAAWNSFVAAHPEANFCHRAEWKQILEKAYALKTHYLYAEVDGVVCGILPLAEVKSIFFGHTLVSTPFCVYGGVCAESEAVASALLDEAVSIAKAAGVDYLELRNRVPGQSGWPEKGFYYAFEKNISADVDENFKAIPRKQRAMIRKGIANGLQSVIDDDIERFYAIYCVSVRNLGTPVYPKAYFRILKETFAGACQLLTVVHEGRPVSSVLSFYADGVVMPYYGGGLPEARSVKAHDFMYWELMRRSCEQGLQVFDFGRSIEGSGAFSFKKNWGFAAQKLYYQQLLLGAAQSPDISPLNSRYGLYIKMWQKLPLPLANLLGPLISRSLG